MLAAITVAGPALGRLSLNLAATPLPGLITLMRGSRCRFIVHDCVLAMRVHPVCAWGTAAIIGSLVLSIAIANSPAGAGTSAVGDTK